MLSELDYTENTVTVLFRKAFRPPSCAFYLIFVFFSFTAHCSERLLCRNISRYRNDVFIIIMHTGKIIHAMYTDAKHKVKSKKLDFEFTLHRKCFAFCNLFINLYICDARARVCVRACV